MGSPKIMVFHIRQLLKTGVFILVGLIIIILLVWALIPKGTASGTGRNINSETSLYNPGTYGSQIILHNKAVDVLVTVNGNAITDIKLLNMEEAQEALYPLFRPAMETLAQSIIENQTTNIQLDPEFVMTGQILLEAINIALNQAYANAITTIHQ